MTARLALAAGELSGDLLGASLAGALRERDAGVFLSGLTGPAMLDAGVESMASIDDLGVMGLFEVVSHLPRLVQLRRGLRDRVLQGGFDAFVGIDAPDFNLGLARSLRRAGVPTIQCVAPSVWAWRRYRIPKIARSLDLLLTLFPFEPELFRGTGLDARFIGHPLADLLPMEPDRATARAKLEITGGRPVVALLPGSRGAELDRHAGLVVRVARNLKRQHDIELLLLLADARHLERFERRAGPLAESDGIRVHVGRTRTGLAAADVALTASGTVTLEALLTKTPMVVFYRLAPATYHLARTLRLVKSRWISLPNVLAGGPLVPERIQAGASVEVLTMDLVAWLENDARRAEFHQQARRIHATLACDAAANAAGHILECIDSHRAVPGS